MIQLAKLFQITSISCGPILIYVLLIAGSSKAEESTTHTISDNSHKLWVNFGGTSWHSHKNSERNTANYGLGIEYNISADYTLIAGQYRNSFYEHSRYAGVAWMPTEFYGAKLGLILGCVDGYHTINSGHFFPFIAPAISIEGQRFGINLIYMPPANGKSQNTFGLQFKVRF